MSEVLVYAAAPRAQTARVLVGAACQATGIGARLEVYGSGSLYQRLGPRHAPPLPDLVVWFGPYAAQAAALDGLLQAHQPRRVADGVAHDPNWRWTTLDHVAIGAIGAPPVKDLQDLARVPRLAMADPERSEIGMSILLATLDRARQLESDVERGWSWWQERARRGVVLAEEEAGAASALVRGGASHALSLSEAAAPVAGLAPIPNAVGLAASARNVEGARRMLDWLTGEAAASKVRLSPWPATGNDLHALVSAAPPLDVDWGRQNYSAARRRWAQSAFGPVVD